MNEVLGPLYYVFAADPDEEWAAHAEADAFFCFQQFMSEIKDYFIKTLDNSSCGIGLYILCWRPIFFRIIYVVFSCIGS